MTKTWGWWLEIWNNVLPLSVWGVLNFKCSAEKKDLWRWVESVKCWCLRGAALELCGWGELSLSWARGCPGELMSPRSCLLPMLQSLQGMESFRAGDLRPAVACSSWQWHSDVSGTAMLCAAPSAALLLGPEAHLRQTILHVLLRSLP